MQYYQPNQHHDAHASFEVSTAFDGLASEVSANCCGLDVDAVMHEAFRDELRTDELHRELVAFLPELIAQLGGVGAMGGGGGGGGGAAVTCQQICTVPEAAATVATGVALSSPAAAGWGTMGARAAAEELAYLRRKAARLERQLAAAEAELDAADAASYCALGGLSIGSEGM